MDEPIVLTDDGKYLATQCFDKYGRPMVYSKLSPTRYGNRATRRQHGLRLPVEALEWLQMNWEDEQVDDDST